MLSFSKAVKREIIKKWDEDDENLIFEIQWSKAPKGMKKNIAEIYITFDDIERTILSSISFSINLKTSVLARHFGELAFDYAVSVVDEMKKGEVGGTLSWLNGLLARMRDEVSRGAKSICIEY